MRRRLGIRHLALLVLLAAAGLWVMQRGRVTRQDPGAVLDALRSAQGPGLPTAAAAGASHQDDVESFNAETLYDFINGAADAYLARGFSRCTATTYSFAASDGGTFDVGAEVYRFGTETGARAQLEAERPPAARPVPGAAAAWMDSGVLLAVTGVDYLKLTAYDSGPAVEEALKRLLSSWREGGET